MADHDLSGAPMLRAVGAGSGAIAWLAVGGQAALSGAGWWVWASLAGGAAWWFAALAARPRPVATVGFVVTLAVALLLERPGSALAWMTLVGALVVFVAGMTSAPAAAVEPAAAPPMRGRGRGAPALLWAAAAVALLWVPAAALVATEPRATWIEHAPSRVSFAHAALLFAWAFVAFLGWIAPRPPTVAALRGAPPPRGRRVLVVVTVAIALAALTWRALRSA